ncbi:Nucleic-acid-binding protein transposon like protein [Argiope bruennichi]|uniref:Nucleic-acid-binding protein transposon like protein n=1 Tax=Argiope bruennichi TaxID=94029 RepID=A0A8T0F5Z1_ARGBR|nr:Nucleic-acid-binding protein transposon like protein [Argiope bruennichi]
MIIKVEKYIRKTVGQGFKCQSFAHVSQNCRMQERCVICAENHDSRKCPQKKAEIVVKKCANCGGPHTASYRGCPKFPKLNVNKNGEIQQGKSFASLFKKVNIQPTPAPSKTPAISTPPNVTEPAIQLTENNQEYEDTFKLLNHLKTITAAIPNLKEILQKLDKEKNPLNKLFILAEAFSSNSV